MRADGFARQPLVRMTNVNLEPGAAGSLEDLIAATDRGLYLETNRSWSIDSRRLHFQFATEAAWEIVDGERTRLLRNPSYAGITPEFWGGLDAICSPSAWRLWGLLNCGKGEPGQVMRVSHGTRARRASATSRWAWRERRPARARRARAGRRSGGRGARARHVPSGR